MSSDSEIIEAVLAGHETRFSELFERYQRRLFGLLWHACSDRELAEDLGQEAFLRAFRKLHLYSGEAQFYTWLARIALNLLASYRRKRRIETVLGREGFEVATDSIGDSEKPELDVELSETQQCVRAAIAMLEEDRRVVILLRDFDGMDYETIAELLSIPIGTVRSRLHRARLDLKSLFQDRAVELGIGEQS